MLPVLVHALLMFVVIDENAGLGKECFDDLLIVFILN